MALPHLGEMNPNREDVGLGGQSRVPAVLGAQHILLRASDGGFGRTALRLCHQHPAIRLRRSHLQGLHGIARAEGGCLRPETGHMHAGVHATGIEHDLLGGDGGSNVGEGVGMVQGGDIEVGRPKAALGEQRSEHEYRLVPALPRLGDLNARKEHRSRLVDASEGFGLGRA
jgi:hypothetical protein